MSQPIRYFVSFAHRAGHGWRVLSRSRPITTAADVEELADALDQDFGSQTSILSFQRMENDES